MAERMTLDVFCKETSNDRYKVTYEEIAPGWDRWRVEDTYTKIVRVYRTVFDGRLGKTIYYQVA